MSAGAAPIDTQGLRGKLTPDAPLAKLVWFKAGGAADWLFEPADRADLELFLQRLGGRLPLMALGLGSNLIVRDGGVAGVVIKLGKPFAGIDVEDGHVLSCGAGAHGILVASTARDAGIAGVEFMRGIPGTVGGFVLVNLAAADLHYSYRHSQLPEGAVVVGARFQGQPGDPAEIGAKMDAIGDARENSQPLRTRTGGSTFKNPPGQKAWELVDAAGCRGLRLGGAQVSEKHTNFLINVDDATSADIEALGEEVKRRVHAHSGVELEWEIQRVGRQQDRS